MTLVVLLKGTNVGGHRTFRPTVLARQLRRFGVVNVGAAGTFVAREAATRTELRDAVLRRLPFHADVMICRGTDIVRLVAGDPFAGQPSGPTLVHFVSVLAKRRRRGFAVPLTLPADGRWCVKVLAHEGRFVLGIHRREMRAIRYLGQLEETFGVPLTTRTWSTMLAITRVLAAAG